jgi:hypothetical protein
VNGRGINDEALFSLIFWQASRFMFSQRYQKGVMQQLSSAIAIVSWAVDEGGGWLAFSEETT